MAISNKQSLSLKGLCTIGCLIAILSLELKMSAQTSDQLLYKSYTTGNMSYWEQGLADLEKQRIAHCDYNTLWNEALACYGYAGYCLVNKNEEKTRNTLARAWTLTDRLLEMAPSSGKTYALRGALYEIEMALSPYKATIYGPKLLISSNRSIELAPGDCYCMIERAVFLWYAPGWVGGNKTEALTNYEKALSIMETKGEQIDNWYYLHTLTMVAKAYEEQKNIAMARLTYHRILKHEENYKKLNEEILPNFYKKYGKE